MYDKKTEKALECLEEAGYSTMESLARLLTDPENQPHQYVGDPNKLRVEILNHIVGHDERVGKVSDGYHTFDELYNHRHMLFTALMRSHPDLSWRSKLHHGGDMFDDYFIAGMDLPDCGYITYHMPMSMWDLCAGIKELQRAPEWDGHSSDDVLRRLDAWLERTWSGS